MDGISVICLSTIYSYRRNVSTQYVWKNIENSTKLFKRSTIECAAPVLIFRIKPSQINKMEDVSGSDWLFWYWDCILIVNDLTVLSKMLSMDFIIRINVRFTRTLTVDTPIFLIISNWNLMMKISSVCMLTNLSLSFTLLNTQTRKDVLICLIEDFMVRFLLDWIYYVPLDSCQLLQPSPIWLMPFWWFVLEIEVNSNTRLQTPREEHNNGM